MGESRDFRLTESGLHWRIGRRSDEIPYDQIRRVRLSFRPTTLQTYRFLTEIWSPRAPKLVIASTSWRSLVDQERHDPAYAAFVTELSRRVGLTGSSASFESGALPIVYWAGFGVFCAASLGMAALLAKALAVQAWLPALFIGGFLGFFLWQTGDYFRRNRPRRFTPPAIPPEVIPRT
jgi:hypothetical protein